MDVLNLIQDLKIVSEAEELTNSKVITTPDNPMSDKPTTLKFPVYYRDENDEIIGTDWVRPMPFMGRDGKPGLADLIHAQEELIKIAVYETAVIADLLCNPQVISLIKIMAAMQTVIGTKDRGIKVDDLFDAGDYIQVARIFMSEGYSAEMETPDVYIPSSIARIHRMNFSGKLSEHIAARTIKFEREQKEKAAKEAKLETAATPAATPVIATTSTPAQAVRTSI